MQRNFDEALFFVDVQKFSAEEQWTLITLYP